MRRSPSAICTQCAFATGILAFAASNINIPTCLVKLLTHTVTTASLSDIICVITHLASGDPPLHVILCSSARSLQNYNRTIFKTVPENGARKLGEEGQERS